MTFAEARRRAGVSRKWYDLAVRVLIASLLLLAGCTGRPLSERGEVIAVPADAGQPQADLAMAVGNDGATGTAGCAGWVQPDPRHTGRVPFAGGQAGNVEWQVEVPTINGLGGLRLDANCTAYVARANTQTMGDIFVIAPDGTVSATVGYDGVAASLSLSGDTIYMSFAGTTLEARHLNGTVLWSWSANTYGDGIREAVVGVNGIVYAALVTSGVVLAFSPDGTMKWSYPTGGTLSDPVSVDEARGRVLAGSREGQLHAIAISGKPLWQVSVGAAVASGISVADDGTVYLIDGDGNLDAFDTAGVLKWSVAMGPLGATYGMMTPAIAHDGTVYVARLDGHVAAVSPEGAVVWTADTPPGRVLGGLLIGADGKIYVGVEGGGMYVLDDSGQVLWHAASMGIAGLAPGRTYLVGGSRGDTIYAVR